MVHCVHALAVWKHASVIDAWVQALKSVFWSWSCNRYKNAMTSHRTRQYAEEQRLFWTSTKQTPSLGVLIRASYDRHIAYSSAVRYPTTPRKRHGSTVISQCGRLGCVWWSHGVLCDAKCVAAALKQRVYGANTRCCVFHGVFTTIARDRSCHGDLTAMPRRCLWSCWAHFGVLQLFERRGS